MAHKNLRTTSLLLGIVTWLLSTPAIADVHARLDGYQENPSVSTAAVGRFRAKLSRRDDVIKFALSYRGIETFVRFAHIHLARTHVNGGVIVWLCDNTGNTPIRVEPCPQGNGTVEGVITPASVMGPMSQGIDSGEFDELLAAIRRRATYVNVHTDRFPSGEIRGQIHGHFGGRDNKD